MIARISTGRNAPADRVWPLLKHKETLLYVTRGFMGFAGSPGEGATLSRMPILTTIHP